MHKPLNEGELHVTDWGDALCPDAKLHETSKNSAVAKIVSFRNSISS
jgi:hypothetical protein